MGEARKHRPTKPKRSFEEQYEARFNKPGKTYDPAVQGYGEPDQWRGLFADAMGFEEAQYRMRDNNPRTVLGVLPNSTWVEVKTAFRRLALQYHPDRAAMNHMTVETATEKMKQLTAAYTVLGRQYGQT